MTSYFPDLNAWVALSVAGHAHNADAWNWINRLNGRVRLIFSRYTRLGLLRLLTNKAVMGEQVVTIGAAWRVYERWLADPRVEFYPEPRGLEAALRKALAPFRAQPASKWVADCYLLAYARQSGATLVSFDKALVALGRKQGITPIAPV